MLNRRAGVLMHVSSLPSPYGIGTLGKEAYNFVDFLAEAGQTYWQMLPLGPTGYGNSPYQSLSSFAGNPYLIDLDLLIASGLLKKEEVDHIDWGSDHTKVDYGKLYTHRYRVLEKACNRLAYMHPEDYISFLQSEKSWLKDYAIFMAIKEDRNGEPWMKWPIQLRDHTSKEVQEEAYRLKERVIFYERVQYLFYEQLTHLKQYANERGIQIIGDLPFYLSSDSIDVWVDPEQFCIDTETYQMEYVSGFPDGQKWGNPLFHWEKMKNEGYAWWCNRAKHVLRFCDVLRIDHFQGYQSFYAVPFDGEAKDGHWIKGPGLEPFQKLEEICGKVEIIIEDLGQLHDEFKNMIRESGYPGMRILEYAFDPNDPYSLYMPFNHEKNSVAYLGTHDNHTVRGWQLSKNEKVRIERACAYLGIKNDEKFVENMIRCLYRSSANTAIVQMQDLLGQDDSCRMNDPENYANAWTYRCETGSYDEKLAKQLKEMMLLYARNNWDFVPFEKV